MVPVDAGGESEAGVGGGALSHRASSGREPLVWAVVVSMGVGVPVWCGGGGVLSAGGLVPTGGRVGETLPPERSRPACTFHLPPLPDPGVSVVSATQALIKAWTGALM